MGGLFGGGSSTPYVPPTPPPPPPAAPVEEATFKPGKEDNTTDLNKAKLGKKKLQIPIATLTSAATATGVNTGTK